MAFIQMTKDMAVESVIPSMDMSAVVTYVLALYLFLTGSDSPDLCFKVSNVPSPQHSFIVITPLGHSQKHFFLSDHMNTLAHYR